LAWLSAFALEPRSVVVIVFSIDATLIVAV
jgi:hypothetical protein